MKKPRSGREPVQVYLDPPDRALLEQAAAASGLSRAEVLRRGLHRFVAEPLADASPALAFLESAASDAPLETMSDVASRHDDHLADFEVASWSTPPSRPKRDRTASR
jgi:hypothetical protein